MVWSVDGDDSSLTLTKIVEQYCNAETSNDVNYKCSPLKQGQKCWWTPEDGIPDNNGRCGKNAPLYRGFTPKCDPDDPSYNCCGEFGFCGSDSEFCGCKECVNYSNNLHLLQPC